ncbi:MULTISPECIES: DHH family phosphoesterase [Sellimonas]|uniref:Cyclic-di-AMP phosphodiesterase n=1 Tax=Sellimonas caecigallum TaxID=2592333 RepID=A0ABS7L4V0_9FIRM|nr:MULTISPECIES: DHH family phosphoesterase [Sellimonas]MBY0758066.1 DHH family phosphoesterase [Sellimonas caecigallum]OUP02571.1 DHH family phosphoesterase [Drancourtella sp. An210]OUP66629.1 DHH family phosphoesterase [Drancourtella sp. An177]
MNKKDNIHFKGQLKLYMQWPAIMTILLIIMNIWIYMVNQSAGFLMSAFVIVYAVIAFILYFYNRSLLLANLVEFAAQYGGVQDILLRELSVPYAILLDDGKILWGNSQFAEIIGNGLRPDTYLSKYIPALNRSVFPKEEDKSTSLEVTYQNRDYVAEFYKVPIEGFSRKEEVLQIPEGKEYFITLYMRDVTSLNQARAEVEEQKMVAGLIYIDNYDEVIDSVEEVRQSLLIALIDRKINQYVATMDGIAKKLEKDRYFIVIKKKFFQYMEEDHFSLMDDVKEISIGNKIPATLSIGLGFSGEKYGLSYNYARVAIDLALARGGDQVVVKSMEGIKYYGGKREQTAKNTRVKARVKAEAMREFMIAKDQILVMGHKLGDSDSFGAAVGIYKIARTLEKKAHIVINEVTMSLRPIYNEFVNSEKFPDDMFVSSQEALRLVDENTMVIVVDTNKPNLTECEELLTQVKTIAVLDHHRQGSNVIENAILSYIEPYASSTCEMVAEVLQYIADDIKLDTIEANSIYAGIMIDTNNFMNRTGVRTFEAAAFLRRNGADITYVHKIFRDDLESYRAKADIIGNAEIYRDCFIIARGAGMEIESPTIVGAQAANELLNIKEVKAAFVLTEYHGKVYVSARSIDEVNVQIIMERIGGGGHINSAGAQFENEDLEGDIDTLKQVIDDMIEGGDIEV